MAGCPAMRMAKEIPHTHTTPQSSLPDHLHTATREAHSALNRSIIARLPLCLPPYTNEPLLYTYGLIVFSQIYLAIEQAWSELLDTSSQPLQTSYTNLRMRRIATNLQTNELPRTVRLQADLKILRGRFCEDAMVTEQLNELEREAHTLFLQPILDSIRSKPHVLLAYAWTMYLALFNGGRWIKLQLKNPGQQFWLDLAVSDMVPSFPLTFWDFEGSDGGESIKLDFKRRFHEAAAQLTAREQADVVMEAQKLFAKCSDMVQFLDKSVAKKTSTGATIGLTIAWMTLALQTWLLPCYSTVLTMFTNLWVFAARGSHSWKLVRLTAKDVHAD